MLIDDTFLDALACEAQASPRLRMNRDLRNSPEDGSQRMLNALEKGTKVPMHRHRGTSETQLLLRGKIDVMFYDGTGRDEGRYGVDIPAGVWHSLEVIEPAVIFESKDGRYSPPSEEDVLALTFPEASRV